MSLLLVNSRVVPEGGEEKTVGCERKRRREEGEVLGWDGRAYKYIVFCRQSTETGGGGGIYPPQNLVLELNFVARGGQDCSDDRTIDEIWG